MTPGAPSWLEASARERVRLLLDADSFREILPPTERARSPHLEMFDLPRAFDDGVVIGLGRLDGRSVLVAAQEGRFMGGTFGEVSGAKITGLLRGARDAGGGPGAPDAVLLLLDTGGVRLQEANAGELAVSEIVRAIGEARRAGIAVLALVGGRAGAFGGGGIVAASTGAIVVSGFGRIGVTGPEVIETNRGVEEFDSKDRALVWRVFGGRTRALSGSADRYTADTIDAFRDAAVSLLAEPPAPFTLPTLRTEQLRLAERRALGGDSGDAPALWRALGVNDADTVADETEERFARRLAEQGTTHGAR